MDTSQLPAHAAIIGVTRGQSASLKMRLVPTGSLKRRIVPSRGSSRQSERSSNKKRVNSSRPISFHHNNLLSNRSIDKSNMPSEQAHEMSGFKSFHSTISNLPVARPIPKRAVQCSDSKRIMPVHQSSKLLPEGGSE